MATTRRHRKPVPVMRREHAFYSHWCGLLDFHLKRLGWTASGFAVKVGRSQQGIHAYLSGRARPPLKQVPVWAAMLGLKGSERDRFIEAAQEAHVPAVVWARLQALERGVAPVSESTDPAQRDRLASAERGLAEVVELLTTAEALFYTRTVPVDRLRAMRDNLGTAIRAAIVRYAVAPQPARK